MRSAHVLAVRAALLGLVLASAGCFKPKILPGGYSCGDGGVNGPQCPDGFICDMRSNTCVTSLGGASGGGSTGTGGESGKGGAAGKGAAGMDGGVRDMNQPDVPCSVPVANCSQNPSDAGICDPVCNTGCKPCSDKCSVNSVGQLTCNPQRPGSPALLDQCDPYSSGASQSDDCEPGQACISPNACGYRCYQFCRTNADCSGGATCSRDAGGGYSMCDVPPVACDPVYIAAQASSGHNGCTTDVRSSIGCYLSATSFATVCDCQNNRTTGNGGIGDSCSKSRDCFAGLVCYAVNATSGKKQCYKVCRLPGDGGVDLTNPDAGESGCSSGISACNPIALPSGMTNPTYGFCNE